MAGRRLPRLARHPDAEPRPARRHRGAARAVLRHPAVHPHPGGPADRPLPVPLRAPVLRHPGLGHLRAADRRAAAAAGPQGGRLPDGDPRQVARRPRRPEVLAAPARVRPPLRLPHQRDRLLHPRGGRGAGLVAGQRAGPRGGLLHHPPRGRGRAAHPGPRPGPAAVPLPGVQRAPLPVPGAPGVPGPVRGHRRPDPPHLRGHGHRHGRPDRAGGRGARPRAGCGTAR